MAILLLVLVWFSTTTDTQGPWAKAHAHNDYEHERPLHEALENGFTSIEVDVHLIKGQLYVAHDRPLKLDANRTLDELYLKPLKERIEENGGKAYAGEDQLLWLMIDCKTEAKSTFEAIEKALKPYEELLNREGTSEGALRIFISGNRDYEQVRASKLPTGIDGSFKDLGKGYSNTEMPVVSENFRNHFKWKGKGKMPEKEVLKLREWIAKVHGENKRIRFWAIPDQQDTWEQLLNEGVDLINTDRLVDFNNYMKTRN